MKGLKDVLVKVDALKRDLEELGAEFKVSVSIDIPLKDLEEAEAHQPIVHAVNFPGVCALCGKDMYYNAARDKIENGYMFTTVYENSRGEQKTRDYFLCDNCCQIQNQLRKGSRLVMEADG